VSAKEAVAAEQQGAGGRRTRRPCVVGARAAHRPGRLCAILRSPLGVGEVA